MYRLLSDQLREFRSHERKKKQGPKGEDQWEDITTVTRVLDLTPVLLCLLTLFLLGRLDDPMAALDRIATLHRAMGAKEVQVPPLPEVLRRREEDDPTWLLAAFRRLGVLPWAREPETPLTPGEAPGASEGGEDLG